MMIGQFVEYKGYTGSIEYDLEDKIHYGSLLDIEDSINYHASNIIELEQQYHNAVNNYVEIKNKISTK